MTATASPTTDVHRPLGVPSLRHWRQQPQVRQHLVTQPRHRSQAQLAFGAIRRAASTERQADRNADRLDTVRHQHGDRGGWFARRSCPYADPWGINVKAANLTPTSEYRNHIG
jgi:hypothetical protein